MEKNWKQKRKRELQSKFRCAACCLCLVAIGPTIAVLANRTGHESKEVVVKEIEQTSSGAIIRWKQESETDEEEPEIGRASCRERV